MACMESESRLSKHAAFGTAICAQDADVEPGKASLQAIHLIVSGLKHFQMKKYHAGIIFAYDPAKAIHLCNQISK